MRNEGPPRRDEETELTSAERENLHKSRELQKLIADITSTFTQNALPFYQTVVNSQSFLPETSSNYMKTLIRVRKEYANILQQCNTTNRLLSFSDWTYLKQSFPGVAEAQDISKLVIYKINKYRQFNLPAYLGKLETVRKMSAAIENDLTLRRKGDYTHRRQLELSADLAARTNPDQIELNFEDDLE